MLPDTDLLSAARRVVEHLDTHDTLSAIDAPARHLLRAVLAVDLLADASAELARVQAERDALAAELAALQQAPTQRKAAFDPCPYCGRTWYKGAASRTMYIRTCPKNPDRQLSNPAIASERARALAAAPAAPPAPESAGPAPTDRVCPDCGETFKNAAGLGNHRARKHPFGARSQQPGAPIRLVDDTPGWRCPTCKSDAFARDLHQPDVCVRCAKRGSDAA